MTQDMIVVESHGEHLPQRRESLFDLEPTQVVQYASKVATALRDVIEKQHLFQNIQGKKYVKVEGWTTLGLMLGILPEEEWVKEHEDGSFEAKVILIKQATGAKIGGASAYCGVDERRWKSAEKFARRSMAVTRATGKAYRLAFSWILSMAGYEVTPAEEMPRDHDTHEPETYQGHNHQKMALAKMAREMGVTEADQMKTMSDKFMGRPMSDLKSFLGGEVNAAQ